MFCSQCGSSTEKGQKFCMKCGAPISMEHSELMEELQGNKKRMEPSVKRIIVFLVFISVIFVVFLGIVFLTLSDSKNNEKNNVKKNSMNKKTESEEKNLSEEAIEDEKIENKESKNLDSENEESEQGKESKAEYQKAENTDINEMESFNKVNESAVDEALHVYNQKVIDITQINDNQMEITFSYMINDKEYKDSFISILYPDFGLELSDRVAVHTLDMDGDGMEELIFKVYYIGNTFADLCGSLHIFKVTDNGCVEILCEDTNWSTPDGGWIVGLYIQDGNLYIETGTKEGSNEGSYFAYILKYVDDNWITESVARDLLNWDVVW